jgi:hypothetical protein
LINTLIVLILQGWECKIDAAGKIYYLNIATGQQSLIHPIFGVNTDNVGAARRVPIEPGKDKERIERPEKPKEPEAVPKATKNTSNQPTTSATSTKKGQTQPTPKANATETQIALPVPQVAAISPSKSPPKTTPETTQSATPSSLPPLVTKKKKSKDKSSQEEKITRESRSHSVAEPTTISPDKSKGKSKKSALFGWKK